MTDIKLNRFEKENQKVMCDANQIAWVIGKRSSDIFRVDEATKKVLILEFVRA
jgi:tRNA(Ile)-lysidine synthase